MYICQCETRACVDRSHKRGQSRTGCCLKGPSQRQSCLLPRSENSLLHIFYASGMGSSRNPCFACESLQILLFWFPLVEILGKTDIFESLKSSCLKYVVLLGFLLVLWSVEPEMVWVHPTAIVCCILCCMFFLSTCCIFIVNYRKNFCFVHSVVLYSYCNAHVYNMIK